MQRHYQFVFHQPLRSSNGIAAPRSAWPVSAAVCIQDAHTQQRAERLARQQLALDDTWLVRECLDPAEGVVLERDEAVLR